MVKRNATIKNKSRRRYVRRPDRLTNHRDIANETKEGIYYALKPLDELVHQMERRWGVDRLPGLVDPEMAARFGAAKAKLDAAIDENEPALVVKRVKVMMKGWLALSDAAEKAGAEEIEADVWEGLSDKGVKYAFCRSGAEAHKAAREKEGYRVLSVDEVVRLLEAQYDKVTKIKDVFPDSIIEGVKNGPVPDDEIPF